MPAEDNTGADELIALADSGATPEEIRSAHTRLSAQATKGARRELDAARDRLLAVKDDKVPTAQNNPSRLTYVAGAAALAALAFQPIIVGLAAIVCGFAADRRGDTRGRPVAAAAALTMSIGMVIHAVRVNSGM